jgi:hypothetical protein
LKKKIILIGVALALVLASVGGGLAYANGIHNPPPVHKLIGVGEVGYLYDETGPWDTHWEYWDTRFIVTNPDDDTWLNIDYLALILEDESVFYEGTPDDWWDDFGIEIPYDLSPNEIWQFSLAELMAQIYLTSYWDVLGNVPLMKYTVEVSWSGIGYSLWLGWRFDRPLSGLAKELCWYVTYSGGQFGGFVISEAKMAVFPGNWQAWGGGTTTTTVTTPVKSEE